VYFENDLIESREIMYIKSGFWGRSQTREFVELVQPKSKLVGFLDDYFTVNWENKDKSIAGSGYKYFLTNVADITSIAIVGIRVDANDVNKRIVEMKFNVRSNNIGKLFYAEEFSIPHFAEFTLYDDGWKYEKALFDLAESKSTFVKDDLYRYKSKSSLEGSALWKMHKLGLYSENWEEIAKRLEVSNDPSRVGAAAWAYHDHDMNQKALSLYEGFVIPKIEETKDPKQIKSVNEYYEKLKNDEPKLVRLQRERKQADDVTNTNKAQIKLLTEMKELEKQAKAEKTSRIKAERAKQRKIDQKKRDAEKREKKRISNLKKEATTKTKSYGQFQCQTSLRAASTVEVTDIGFKSISDNVLERCGDINFLYQKGDLVKSQCFSSYGKKYPCVGFKNPKNKYLKSEISFSNISDQEKFFVIAKKSLKIWRRKYDELLN